jgi:signal transduction histidine kinase
MTSKRLFVVLLISAVLALTIQWISMENRHLQLKQLTNIACEMVSARAQAGSTRDVHDQLYSFWHKHNPGSRVDVLVKRGEKEVGARTSLEQKNSYVQSCQIENQPDYEITFRFEDEKILGFAVLEKFATTFIILLVIVFLFGIFLRTIRELWSGQVLSEVRKSLGLGVEPTSKSNLLSRFLAKAFLNSAASLKPAIVDLQQSLTEKQSELKSAKGLVSKMEEERIRADEFATMVTMVRHDLKGPLSSLKITASGINQLPEESASLRQTIVSIEKIISDLDQRRQSPSLTLKEILTLEIVEVAIQDVVDEKSGAFASHRGVEIDFEYNHSALSPVMCDPNHLRRMIANLLQNAIEASPRSSLIRIGVRHDQGYALIEVADQGPGISQEILPRLFERGATFGKVNGTGEGLSFVKFRAESFGGAITVVETSTSGTVFQLKLPLAETKAHFRAMPSTDACQKMVILDDEIEFQKQAWSKRTATTEYFSSPHALLNWIEATPEAQNFSYLVDLHLRDVVTGIDVIRTLGKEKRSYLATTDYLNPEALELSESLGISIIPKSLMILVCRED